MRFTNNNFVGSMKVKDNNLEAWETSQTKKVKPDEEEEKFFEESIEEEISC